MNENQVRQKVIAGETAVGCFLGLGSPSVTELLAYSGYEWLLVETEHNALDSAQVERMLMAIDGSGALPMVRVPPSDLFAIQKALDIGAMGIIVPMVKTVEEAEAVVAATRYPPEGSRGFGPLRASRYTLDYEDYLERANRNILVGLLLETAEAVEDLERIASVPGVDLLYMGMWDLSLALGVDPRRQPNPETDAVIDKALKVGQDTGVAIGIGVGSPEDLAHRWSRDLPSWATGATTAFCSAEPSPPWRPFGPPNPGGRTPAEIAPCESTSFLPPPAVVEEVRQGAEDEQGAHGHLLHEDRDAQDVQGIADDLKEDHPQQRPRHGAPSPVQARSSNDHRRDDVQLGSGPCQGEGRIQTGRQQDPCKGSQSAAQGVEQELMALDADPQAAGRFGIVADGESVAPEARLHQHQVADQVDRRGDQHQHGDRTDAALAQKQETLREADDGVAAGQKHDGAPGDVEHPQGHDEGGDPAVRHGGAVDRTGGGPHQQPAQNRGGDRDSGDQKPGRSHAPQGQDRAHREVDPGGDDDEGHAGRDDGVDGELFQDIEEISSREKDGRDHGHDRHQNEGGRQQRLEPGELQRGGSPTPARHAGHADLKRTFPIHGPVNSWTEAGPSASG